MGGLECFIDQYINGDPPEGWQRWMEKQIELAKFVLLVCTPLYLKRFKGENTDAGRGANLEGLIISQTLYDDFQRNTKFIPVIPDDGQIDNVPLTLKGSTTYSILKQYEDLYRVLTDQHPTPARKKGELKILPSKRQPDDSNITKNSSNNKSTDIIWLSFHVDQNNGITQADCQQTDSQQINLLPRETLIPSHPNHSSQYQSMFELLFGEGDKCLEFLQQFPETETIKHPDDAKIRMRIMTDDAELAMLPWQQMQFPTSGKPILEAGWMVETGPNLRRYQPGFNQLGITTPLIIIPVGEQHNTSGGQHYSLVHDYLNSYLGIDGMIPRISTLDQLKRALEHEQPDLIYFYCCINNDVLLLDDGQVSLQELSDWIKQASLYPSEIFNLIGATQFTYPQSLLENTRLVWLQTIRSQIKARTEYEQSLLNVLEKLTTNEDLAELITNENSTNQQNAYLWLNGRSPALNRDNDAGHVKQQLRAALLRVMLGRKELKGSMNSEIANSTHREQRNVLVYAISGDQQACPQYRFQ